MDNAMYVGLSRQMTLRRELDIAANNIANADTAGFKLEELMTRSDPAAPARTAGVFRPVTFVMDDGVARDFRQGALRQTGGALDVGIDGQGFFKIQTADGERYSRDGRFKLDSTGKLITQDGDAVQGDGGDIVIDPLKGPVSISESGIVSQDGQRTGQLSVERFDSLAALEKDGNNLYRNTSNLTPAPATDAKLRQGMLEGSNVQSVVQITHLIQVSRAYETITSMMNQTADLSRRSIQRLGAVS
jgi:flagellar basal-body rod protein FlgF